MTDRKPETTGRQQARTRFAPGESGNPTGRPKGARHRVTLAVEALLEGDADRLTRKAVELALAGDTTALRLCLERIAPAPKERSINVELPAIASASDLPGAMAAVLTAVSAGELTPGEGQAVAAIVERWRAAFELSEIEQRLRALEGRSQ